MILNATIANVTANEQDKFEFVYRKFPCLIYRDPEFGFFRCQLTLINGFKDAPMDLISVHGGWTTIEDDTYTFHLGHSFDLAPFKPNDNQVYAVYRNQEYAMNELKSAIDQLYNLPTEKFDD